MAIGKRNQLIDQPNTVEPNSGADYMHTETRNYSKTVLFGENVT
jgi:hypothetical protein